MATTALVVAAAFAMSGTALAKSKSKAKPASLKITGNILAGFGAIDDDENGSNGRHVSFDVYSDSEIHFKGSATLANGIKIGATMELQGAVYDSTNADETHLNISGGFGKLELGAQDNAAKNMVGGYLGSGAVGVGISTHLGVNKWIDLPSGHAASANNPIDVGSDNDKISYYTPRMSGLAVGVSYSPSATSADTPAALSDGIHTIYAVAATFDRKMGNASFGIAAGYTNGHESGGTDHGHPAVWGAGFKVDYDKIRVSAGVTHEWNRSAETATTDAGDLSHDFGIKYTMDKNNSFSLGYVKVTDQALRSNTNDDETEIGVLAYQRALGKGVAYRLSFAWAEYEGEVDGTSDDNDGIALINEVKLSF